MNDEPLIYVRLRGKIVARFKTKLPRLKTCRAHGGPLTHEHIKKMVVGAPAVLVSLMGQTKLTAIPGGALDAELKFAAFILTSGSQNTADIAAINLTVAVTQLIAGSAFDDCAYPVEAESVTAQGLYLPAGKATGLALWAVEWLHRVRIGPRSGFGDDDVMLTSLYVQGDENVTMAREASNG